MLKQLAFKLPAYEISDDLNKVITANPITVVTAPPGAGKSTLLPITMLDGLRPDGKIIMMEPRRLAARQVAERLSSNIGETVGKTVGYTMRFEKRVSNETRIEVVTEGIMMRKLIVDPMLEDVSIVVFDEFHERSLTSDVALALIREAQQLLRPDLKILIMSATIDTTQLCHDLNAPLVESSGRLFDVQIIEEPRNFDTTDTESIAQDTCTVIRKVISERDGDMLVFLPGQGEIMRCMDMLSNVTSVDVYPLFGNLPPEKQCEAIMPSANGKRKVVLATSIAETSLTIEGVRIVIDSGFCRRLVTDHRTGLTHLETVRISHDMATQRRGRAGRVAEGVCYQMWNTAIDHGMKPTRVPEIADADLASTILQVMSWGESDIEVLPWLTMPPHANVIKAQQILLSLKAISTTAKGVVLTESGRKMASMPCHPRIAKMLVMAGSGKSASLACDIASLLEERDPLSLSVNDADINTRIAVLRQSRKRRNIGRWSRVEKVSAQYRHLIGATEDNEAPDHWCTGALIAIAYPERIGRLQQNGRFRLSSGDNAVIDTADQLSSYDWVSIASMNSQSGNVFLASPVNPDDVVQEQYDNVAWNSKEGRVVAQRQWRAGRLVVNSKPIHDIPREKIHAILIEAARKDGLSMFDFNDDVKQLQRRISITSEWHPELSVPELSTESILSRADEWLPFYAGKATASAELKKLDMCEVIWSLVGYDLQQDIERLAPSHILMPDGRRKRLEYRQGALVPVLSVRLQECFGMTDTPCINDGRQPILMELLSPGFKPVQLTQDLRSFWQTTYFDVRKELRRRYPKHAWPENPL